MSTKYENVIVFGPSGAVASAAVAEASKRGAKVWLAMRDTSKSINQELDDKKRFSRVQADLTDPESVTKAVKTSGATAAFVYLAHQSRDAMRSVLSAMKDAGIEYIVFLSSFTIKQGQAIRDVAQSEIIPYVHAQVEIQLEELEIPHTALRPGNFATNQIGGSLDTSKTPYEAVVTGKGRATDCIVPSDIGKIGGAVLTDRPSSSSKEIIYIFGPQLIPLHDLWKVVQEVSKKEINVTTMTEEEAIKDKTSKGVPKVFAEYLARWEANPDISADYPDQHYKTGVNNIRKYAGYEPTTYRDFVAAQPIAQS